MKLYRAETGRLVDWQSNSTTNVETLDELYQIVETCTGIPSDCQILMTSYGQIVKQNTVKEVVEATGEREYIVFCYDRELLIAHPDQVSGILDREIPTLEPDIPGFDGAASLKQLQQASKKRTIQENCDSYVELFVKFDSYSRTLIKAATAHMSLASTTVEEQKLQSMALSVALANLKSHIGTGKQNANAFIERARRELNRQNSLLKSLQSDLDILKHTSIHPSILENIELSGQQQKTKLIDFIDMQQIEVIRVETVNLVQYLDKESVELKKASQEIVTYERQLQQHITANSNLQSLDATLEEIKALFSKAQDFRKETKKNLPRIYDSISKLTDKPISALFENLSLNNPSILSESSLSSVSTTMQPASSSSRQQDDFVSQQQRNSTTSVSAAKRKFESFNHLAEYQLDDPLLKLAKCEAKIRQHVDGLIDSKRDSITEFFNNMKVIAELQDHIALLQDQAIYASAHLEEFKSKYGKKDLESVRQVSFAYGALLIEMVRRKEYIKILVKNSNILADVLAEYRAAEEKRRENFRRTITKSLPFQLTGFDKKASPQSEITLNKGGANHECDQDVELDKKDITEFVSLLGAVYFQPSSQNTMSRRPSFLSPSSSLSSSQSSSKNGGSRRNSSLSANKSSSNKAATNDENLAKLLNAMFKQLNDMRSDFLKTIEYNFFTVNKIMIDPSRIKEVLDKQEEMAVSSPPRFKLVGSSSTTTATSPPPHPLRRQTAPTITVATATASAISYSSSPAPATTPSSPKSNSSSRSGFSVVEDDKKLVLTYIEENTALKTQLESVKQEAVEAQREYEENNRKQADEIQRLKEVLKNLESEKEEFESQIQNLDQLVDNERQTFEQNRQSFLQELKNKDKSADFRIQSAEEDFQSKICDLQYALEEEKRMKKNLEIEHASELNTIQDEHTAEIEKIKVELADQTQATQDALNEKWELNRRLDQLMEDMANIQHKLETERVQYEEQLSRLQVEIEDKEKATDEIKLLQQQTRSMVKRAQDDWEYKNEELKSIKVEQELVEVAVRDLLHRFRMNEHKTRELDLKTDIKLFKENLEEFTQRYDDLQYNYGAMTQELAGVSEAYKGMTEVHQEWRTMASHMAEKLEEYRKSVFYELTQRLQLPMDEAELNVLTRNITPSDDDLAIWNQILHLASSIPTQKFVLRVLDHYKTSHDRYQQYKSQYRHVKEKYIKLTSTPSDKIAFRNFQPGDVALFLPTRNSTGKPWAAFNINAPHYFLTDTNSSPFENNISAQMATKEWIVARIVTITEHITDIDVPGSNPYGLTNGTKYYQLETEHWRKHHSLNTKTSSSSGNSSGKKRMASSTSLEQPQCLADFGLATLGAPTTGAIAGSPPNKRPSFSNVSTSSSNNIVHSYVNK